MPELTPERELKLLAQRIHQAKNDFNLACREAAIAGLIVRADMQEVNRLPRPAYPQIIDLSVSLELGE